MTIFEGTIEELLAHQSELQGKRLRVEILSESIVPAMLPTPHERATAFTQWAQKQKPITHPIDDSRDSIYGGTLDDPR